MLSLAGCAGRGATSTAAPPDGTQRPSSPALPPLPPVSTADAAVIAVITATVAASNTEQIDAYMACIDPSSPLYSSTRTQMMTTFEQYDFHVEVTDIEVLDVSAAVAHVQAVLTTTKISGPAYKDNRLTVVFELHEVSAAGRSTARTSPTPSTYSRTHRPANGWAALRSAALGRRTWA